MKTILLTNDDGIHSVGLHALIDVLKPLAEVQVIAPDRERSAVSHSFSMNHPLRARKMNGHITVIDGTPTDCVMFGALGYLPRKPDLVVSGINTGPNMGDDVTYSGTVAAALEATMLRIPSFAISMGGRIPFGTEYEDASPFKEAAEFAAVVARDILTNGVPPGTFLNVNVPISSNGSCKGVKITRLGKRIYMDRIIERIDPQNRTYYWIGGPEPEMVPEEGTDFQAVKDGYISVTPLRFDLTNHSAISDLEQRNLPLKPDSTA